VLSRCVLISASHSPFPQTMLTVVVKDSAAGGRRPYEALGRQGAVRKRKGDVYEMNGHQFVQRQFYQPIMCALCQEFLLTGEGYQCEDCRYACHKKCYPKVVTKCISKTTADGVSHLMEVLPEFSANNTGRRRGKDQSPNPSSIRRIHQHVCKLVLSLWLHVAFWSKEFCQMFRMFYHMSSNLFASGPRFLWYDDGNGQHSTEKPEGYQNYPSPQKAHHLCDFLSLDFTIVPRSTLAAGSDSGSTCSAPTIPSSSASTAAGPTTTRSTARSLLACRQSLCCTGCTATYTTSISPTALRPGARRSETWTWRRSTHASASRQSA